MTDGTSGTLLVAEIRQGQVANDLRGLLWYGVTIGFTAKNPPNSRLPDHLPSGWCPSGVPADMPCAAENNSVADTTRQMAARSRHAGGVQVLLGDGSVRFVSESIHLPTWRGLSTMAGGEVVSDF